MTATTYRIPSQQEIDAVVDSLASTPTLLEPMVREAPPEVLKKQPRPGRWSMHEHACHLADIHDLFFERLDYMLRTEEPEITPYDPADDEPEGFFLTKDLTESLERFRRDRARLVDQLRALTPEQWAKTAAHPEYDPYSIFIMFRHLSFHDALHAFRMEELMLSDAQRG